LETYFLGEALTAEARRVAELENDALRYDVDIGEMEDPALQWILRDLHQNEFLRESARLATLIQTRGAAVHVGNNRGVSQSGLVVLRTATRPAVLIETGFATNRRDGAYLASAEGQRKLATAIADGIVDYLREYERKVLLEELP
jgi:N-acetylmuramoyl-L-alanine amidase